MKNYSFIPIPNLINNQCSYTKMFMNHTIYDEKKFEFYFMKYAGPGCSSVGDGFSSVGPFVTTNNARGLQRNLFSWNKGFVFFNV